LNNLSILSTLIESSGFDLRGAPSATKTAAEPIGGKIHAIRPGWRLPSQQRRKTPQE